MFVLAVLTPGMHVALPTALYLQRILVLLIDVHACCDFAVDFIGNKVIYVVVIFISTLPMIHQGISISLAVLSTFRVFEESSVRRATVPDGCLHFHAEPNFPFRLKVSLPLKLKCPSTSRRPYLKNPFRLQSCLAQAIFRQFQCQNL